MFEPIVEGSEVLGLVGGQHGGKETWLSQVDSVKLSAITLDKVQKWKLDFLTRPGNDIAAQRTAT